VRWTTINPMITFGGEMRMRITRIIMILFIIMSLTLVACAAQGALPASSKTALKFETIGIKGSTVLITLISPSPEVVSPEDLASKIKTDWQNQLKINTNPRYQNQVHVMVFDNKDAPQRWVEIWETSLSMTDQEWAKEQARIFPHRIANYDRNTTSGLNEVQILSRDSECKVVTTIKFWSPQKIVRISAFTC
jgi:hypothetical protein